VRAGCRATSTDSANAAAKRAASARAKAASRTTTLASRFSSSGSMFELPTVAQLSSTTATLACRNAGVYSKIEFDVLLECGILAHGLLSCAAGGGATTSC